MAAGGESRCPQGRLFLPLIAASLCFLFILGGGPAVDKSKLLSRWRTAPRTQSVIKRGFIQDDNVLRPKTSSLSFTPSLREGSHRRMIPLSSSISSSPDPDSPISSMSPEARGRKRGSGRQERPQPNQQNGDEGTIAKEGRAVDPGELLVPPRLPKHPTNDKVNRILERCQEAITAVYAKKVEPPLKPPSSRGKFQSSEDGKERGLESKIFSNANVDLGKIDVVGFDYDYTLVSYGEELQSTIYDMAKTRLVEAMRYPTNLAEFSYDPAFAIRGLAVDLELGWLCQLSHSSDVVQAYNGRTKVSPEKLFAAYSGSSAIPPEKRKERFKPLNDLFSMAEACLLADVVDFFVKTGIPFNPRIVVEDVLKAIGSAHISGAMHRAVLEDVEKYIEFPHHLREILERFKSSGKKLWLVSNSQFWYVDGGMKHVIGDDWRDLFEVVIVGAGKPGFYTNDNPFREVSARTGRIKFKPIEQLEEGGVYTQGSIKQLLRITKTSGEKVLYLGDSIFADLSEARRSYGIATGAVIHEVKEEMDKQKGSAMWRYARHTTHVLSHSFRLIQEEMGLSRSADDIELLDKLESEVNRWRDIQEHVINANFGSIFRAGDAVSKFAASMRRHADLYTSSVENLRFYSTEQRFYPDGGHESVPFNDPLLDYIIGDDSALL